MPMSSGFLLKFMLASFLACLERMKFVEREWVCMCVSECLCDVFFSTVCCRIFDGWMLLSKPWTPTAKRTLFSMLIQSDRTMTDPIKNSSPTTNKPWVGLRVLFFALSFSISLSFPFSSLPKLRALLTNSSLTTNSMPAFGKIVHGFIFLSNCYGRKIHELNVAHTQVWPKMKGQFLLKGWKIDCKKSWMEESPRKKSFQLYGKRHN